MKFHSILIGILTCLVATSCSTRPGIQHSPPFHEKVSPYSDEQKKILVFLDGTNNEWDSRTNVRRLYEMISSWDDPKTICLYADGVGTSSRPVTGIILGRGMKSRILEGYQFISEHYNPGDDVYIFGFSRGAHQARSLAGLISFCGVLPKKSRKIDADKVWDLCKEMEETPQDWESAMKARIPLIQSEFRSEVKTRWAEVKFVGVWDTVPGSLLVEYGPYSEDANDGKKGTRYKVDAYPPIEHIAHAMSLDEMRSQFNPIQVAPPVSPSQTRLREVWFSGAHSDVGGGYSDSSGLSGLTLNWMLQEMAVADPFWAKLPRVYESSRAAQHDSSTEFPGNFGSKPVRRRIDESKGNPHVRHKSVAERESIAEGVWIRTQKNYSESKSKYAPKAEH